MQNYIDLIKHFYSLEMIIAAVAFVVVVLVTAILIFKKKLKKALPVGVIVSVLIASFFGVVAYDMNRDINCIKANDIEIVSFSEAGFNTKYNDNDILLTPVVAKLNDGNELSLKSIKSFPAEIKNGTVTYLEKSRIILDYSGDVVKE